MPVSDGETVNNRKEGLWITYYANENKRSEGSYKADVKEGKWIQYHQNGKKQSEGTFVDGVYAGKYISYHKNGKKNLEGLYYEYTGKSTDGKKVGEWKYFDTDGKTVWRVITYKRGARTKADDHPLGECVGCGKPRKSMVHDKCPSCGEIY